jgi:Vault protein inter-alpha-trypsin domain/von Willebrand factor type A domain
MSKRVSIRWLVKDSPPHLPLPFFFVCQAQVHDFVAEVQLSQCYYNNTDKNLECTYHFPIYEGAAVCGFEAEYQDCSVVKGIVKEKEAAREEYETAKRDGKQANLLESVRRDVFTLSVGNLPPDMYVKITITYVATLESRDDAAAFVLPTCIAPRYIPAATTPVCLSDAQALAPPESNVKLFGLDIVVDVTCHSTIKTITSPTHAADLIVSTSHQNGRFSLKDIEMDRDVVVLIEEEKCHQPRASIEISPVGSMTGFVTFYPQIEFPDQQREFVFVVDRSGSMEGQQIEQARDTLLLYLRSLPTSCTFNIVGFGSHYQSLFADGPKPYNDETLTVASAYVASMQADFGGTEILEPLRAIFDQTPAVGVERQVFVLTDGQVSNDTQVFDLIRQHCTAKERVCRLFSVGVGQNVSRLLVSGMARAGRGTSRFVEDGSIDALRVKVLGQLKQSMQPSLDNVSIDWTFPKEDLKLAPAVKTLLGYRSPSVDASTSVTKQPKLYPANMPPVFNKEKFIVYAMFACGDIKPDGVIVKCETIDGPLEVKLAVAADEIFHGAIAKKLAARTAISEYEDSCKSHGNFYDGLKSSASVISESEALQLALSNGLASAKTSFIAVLEKPVVDPNSPQETKTIPQASTSGASPSVLTAQCFRGMAQSAPQMALRACMLPKQPGIMARRSAPAVSLASRLLKPFLFPGAVASFSYSSNCCSMTPSPPVNNPNRSKSDKVLQLCLLQKADGSFVLSDDLLDAMGLTKVQVDTIFYQLGAPNKVVFATVLALAVLRVMFANQRSIWELQEQKVLAFLVGCCSSHPMAMMTTTSELLLSEAETLVRNIKNNV